MRIYRFFTLFYQYIVIFFLQKIMNESLKANPIIFEDIYNQLETLGVLDKPTQYSQDAAKNAAIENLTLPPDINIELLKKLNEYARRNAFTSSTTKTK